jgi:hypothetical protein
MSNRENIYSVNIFETKMGNEVNISVIDIIDLI